MTARNTLSPTPADQAPQYVAVDALADNVERCRNVVSPDFDVDTSSLWASGWSYTQPRMGAMGRREFESIQYMQDGLTLALLDFGDFVICRAVGMVQDPGSIDQLRARIASNHNATPMVDHLGLRQLSESILAAMPNVDTQNLLVAGDYQIEIGTQTVTAAQHGQEGYGDLVMLMVTTNPLPAQFRNYDSAQAE